MNTNKEHAPETSIADDLEITFKRQHELSNAIRTLELIIQELEEGYQFDDKDAPENLRLFKCAVETIRNRI